jgi:DNA-binding beta-propeller fold protein YncE
MKKIFVISFFMLLSAAMWIGCTDRDPIGPFLELENSFYQSGDTSYLEIYPPLQSGFNGPTAVLCGNDQLLYVADTRNNRVVMLDAAGGYLGKCFIDKPTALAQDFRLDLLVGGTVTQNGYEMGALFRIRLVEVQHRIDSAKINIIWKESAHPQRRFTGIAVMPDNQYLVARTGSDNSSPIDPDTRVMLFNASDGYSTPLTDLATGTGTGIIYINHLTGIAAVPGKRDFIVIQDNSSVYGAIWMVYAQSADFEGYTPKFDPTNSRDAYVNFVATGRFVYPTAVAIDSKRLDVFITDAARDTVFKFNSKGEFKHQSFGKFATGNRMVSPSGAAFFDKTLYVADSTSNCIFRFKLSTDF